MIPLTQVGQCPACVNLQRNHKTEACTKKRMKNTPVCVITCQIPDWQPTQRSTINTCTRHKGSGSATVMSPHDVITNGRLVQAAAHNHKCHQTFAQRSVVAPVAPHTIVKIQRSHLIVQSPSRKCCHPSNIKHPSGDISCITKGTTMRSLTLHDLRRSMSHYN